jgi:adenylate cyclase
MSFVSNSGYRFGPFVLNLERMCLQENGEDLELRPKAFDVLRHLIQQAGRVVTKDDLVAAVWPNVIVNDDALAQCVRDIRKALKDEGERYVRTVPRRGYMFVAEVAPLAAIGSKKAAQSTTAARRWPARPAIVAALLLVFAVIGSWNFGWRAAPEADADARLTIAVLPFAAGTDEEWLGDGVAEGIMNAVSHFRDLAVIARNSSFRYRDPVDAREVGKELGADFLLLGTARLQGDNLRISAQLVDARTGTSRWSRRYDRPFTEIFEVEDDVADQVASHLVSHAKEAAFSRLHSRPPQDLDAYELTLRARKTYRLFTRESALEARALAERAIARDPDYAPAWEVLAAALLQFYIQPYSEHQGSPEMLRQARAAAERAAALDPNFSTGQAMLAFALMWSREHEASRAAIDRAKALNANDLVAHGIEANIVTFAGRFREAVDAWERAERLDPFWPAINLALKSLPLVMLGEYEQALRLSRSCAERAPRLFACVLYRAIAAASLGLTEEAEEAKQRMFDIYPQFSISRHLRIVPFYEQADALHLADLMRTAGFPE